jgi:tetratricopeptide (TPR) repeat protein
MKSLNICLLTFTIIVIDASILTPINVSKQAMAIPVISGDNQVLQTLKDLCNSASDFQKVQDLCGQYLRQSRQMRDQHHEATALNLLGSYFGLTGRYLEAEKYSRQSLEIFQQIGKPIEKISPLGNLANIATKTGEYPKAIVYFQQILKTFQDLKEGKGEAMTLGNLGILHKDLGQIKEAVLYFQQALPIFRKENEYSGEALILNHLGVIAYNSGDVQQALIYQNNAMKVLQRTQDPILEAHIYKSIGYIFVRLSQYQKAEFYAQKSLEIFRRKQDQGKCPIVYRRSRVSVAGVESLSMVGINDGYSIPRRAA